MADKRIRDLARTEVTLPDTGDYAVIGDKDVGDNDFKITVLNYIAALEDGMKALARVLTNKSIDADNNTITNIANASIKALADIAVNKLHALTANRAIQTDGSGFLEPSAITATELAILSGITSTTAEINTLDGTLGNVAGLDQSLHRNYQAIAAGITLIKAGLYIVDTSGGAIQIILPILSPDSGGCEILIPLRLAGNDLTIIDNAADSGFSMITGDDTQVTGTIITLSTANDFVLLRSSGLSGGYWGIVCGFGVDLS